MSVTAYKFAGTAANVDRDSKVAWANPDNAKDDDADYTECILAKNGAYGDWLRLSNFGFTTADIPAGSTINGIELIVGKYLWAERIGYDNAIYMRKTAGRVGSNYASATAWNVNTASDVTYGGATNLWGTTWSEGDVKSTDFGVDISPGQGDNNTLPFRILYAKIRVYYTEGSAPAPTFIPRIIMID